MRQAVCAVITNELGEILTVSRKDNPSDKNLPGGKVDENETLEEALIREIKEETGLSIISESIKKVFTDLDGEFEVTTFICQTFGEIKTSETGIVEFINWDKLLTTTNSFYDYNLNLYRSLTWNLHLN